MSKRPPPSDQPADTSADDAAGTKKRKLDDGDYTPNDLASCFVGPSFTISDFQV